MKKHLLSKSGYIRSLQCLKSLYLYKFHYKLRDPVSPDQLEKFARGHRVGKYAQLLFPGGIDLTPSSIYQYQAAVQKTNKIIANGWHVLYEPAFQYDDVLVALDILVKKSGLWYAYEVKSSYTLSDTNLEDAALQYYIITGSGLVLEDFRMIYMNNNFESNASPEINKLFNEESVLHKCLEKQPEVAENIARAKEMLTYKLMPDVATGKHCNKPYPCDFIGTCWKGKK